MELYRILMKRKNGEDASWFFVMDVYETREAAEAHIERYKASQENYHCRVIMFEAVLF